MNDKDLNPLKEKLIKGMSKKKLTVLADIIDKKSPCSLRLIEWFVSYYSKEHATEYLVNGKMFNVYSSYKDEQMTSYNKKLFDMYRRMERINVKLDNKRVLSTTIAQLNFFTWVFKNKILDYVLQNMQTIRKDLERTKVKKTKKKFFDQVKITHMEIVIHFD